MSGAIPPLPYTSRRGGALTRTGWSLPSTELCKFHFSWRFEYFSEHFVSVDIRIFLHVTFLKSGLPSRLSVVSIGEANICQPQGNARSMEMTGASLFTGHSTWRGVGGICSWAPVPSRVHELAKIFTARKPLPSHLNTHIPLDRCKTSEQTFGPKKGGSYRWTEESCHVGFHNLYFSRIIRANKSRRMSQDGHIVSMKEMRNSYKILAWKHQGKRQLGRTKCRWQVKIKTEREYEDVGLIHLARGGYL
jgi:hypothetical protein